MNSDDRRRALQERTEQRLRAALAPRPRKVSEILEAGLALWQRCARVVAPLVAAIGLPFYLLSALALLQGRPSVVDAVTTWTEKLQNDPNAALDFTNAMLVRMVLAVAAFLLALILSMTAAMSLYLDVHAGRAPDRGRAIAAVLRRGPIAVAAVVIAQLASLALSTAAQLLAYVNELLGALAALAALPLSIWLTIRLAVGVPAAVAEGANPLRAVRRSFSLSRRRFWSVLGASLLGALVIAIVGGTLSNIVSAVLRALGGNNSGFEFVWVGIGQSAGSAITVPIVAGLMLSLFIDLRTRADLSATAAAAPPAPPAQPTLT